MDDGIVRIVVSSDNHLGYAERDPVRGDDSFASFEEMLYKAREDKADFIILAGDLFHENKPSRRTLFVAMELFRKYSLGPDPVYTEILNDQSEIFRSNQGSVNYEDPYLSVQLPIFAIHGNHDDPSREGGQGESLAALDLLAINNVVNYFGKTDKVDDIEVTPILIRKRGTHIALYGLGAIRDERLNRMWNLKKIKFIRPSKEQGGEKFFNIFVLHQNRDYGRGKKNCVHESMIPEWMDLVIWGNEHECKPDLAESLVGTFRLYQPGSSVATSLSEVESFQKSFGLIEVRDDKRFRMTPKRYYEIRPFIFREVSLQDVEGLTLHDPKIEDKIKLHLAFLVNEMVEGARDLVKEIMENRIPSLRYYVKDPSQILIRMKVDPGNLPTLNQQRFGAQFVGKVGNPSDILLYSRKRKEAFKASAILLNKSDGAEEINDELVEDNEGIGGVHKIKVEELVVQALETNKRNLSILPESDLGMALEDYVKRKHANAFIDSVNETLEQTQQELFKTCKGYYHEEIEDAVRSVKIKLEDQIRKGDKLRETKKIVYSDDEGEANEDDDQAANEVKTKSTSSRVPAGGRGVGSRGRGAGAGRGTGRTKANDVEPKRARSSAKSKTAAATDSDIESVEPAPKRKTSRQAAKKTYVEPDSEEDAEEEEPIERENKKKSRSSNHDLEDNEDDFHSEDDGDRNAKPKLKSKAAKSTNSKSSSRKKPGKNESDEDIDSASRVKSKVNVKSSALSFIGAADDDQDDFSGAPSRSGGLYSYFSQKKTSAASDWN